LFGSRARGENRADSDVDLMVEMESDLPRRQRATAVYQLFHPRYWSMDVLVYTPEEVREWGAKRYSFVSEVLRTGRTIYERSERPAIVA
jgi:predicted nucleotidyltransferase